MGFGGYPINDAPNVVPDPGESKGAHEQFGIISAIFDEDDFWRRGNHGGRFYRNDPEGPPGSIPHKRADFAKHGSISPIAFFLLRATCKNMAGLCVGWEFFRC